MCFLVVLVLSPERARVVKQCLLSGATDGASVLEPRPRREEKKGRCRRVARATQDAEQRSPAKILQYSLSSKVGLQPSKYSGWLTG